MNAKMKMTVGIGAAAAIVATTVGGAALANAETATPTPAPGQTQGTQNQGGWGRGGGMGGMGARNGSGYGATANVTYLAEKLGVNEDAVRAALTKYRTENGVPTTRGRDMTADQQTAQHEKLAAFLAKELKVDEAKVLDALNAQQETRQADRTAQLKANLDAAVKDGRLTQAQADAILAAHESGAMRGGMGRGMGKGGPRR